MRLGEARALLAVSVVVAMIATGCSLLLDTSSDAPPPSPNEAGPPSSSPADGSGGGEQPVDASLSDGSSTADDAATDGGELPGLVLHFAFEDLTGNVVKDLSGKGNDGLVVNDPTLAPGIVGQGIQTDGINDRVRVTALDGIRFPVSGTLSFWAKPSSFAGQWIVDQYDVDRDHIYVRLRAAEGTLPTRLEAVFQRAVAEPNSALFGAFVPINVGQWVHVVVVWDTQEHKAFFYANNTLIETKNIDSTWAPKAQVFELFRPGCCGSFPGVLDELRLYNRALSPLEVAKVP